MDKTRIDPALPVTRSASEPAQELRALGPYRVLRRLGEGGMGAVYLGYDEQQDRQVALKVLPDALANNQNYLARFYREAQSAFQLDHPHIVRGYAVGQDPVSRKHYFALEYVDGVTALDLLNEHGPLSVGDGLHIIHDVARALEHAQSRSIVHRDIKPDNILITRAGVAKLADLGLAKRTDEDSHLTATKQGFGTPYYMPYEQAMNAKAADARSDLYALGCTLYHLLTGRVPFPGASQLEIMDAKNAGIYPPAREFNPKVTPLLEGILARMLARQPEDRYQLASELLVDLDRSGLVPEVPSFADREAALQDPCVQARLAQVAQPTMPDLEKAARPPVNGKSNVWYLRGRSARGKPMQTRTTTEQVTEKLRTGKLSLRVEASRSAEGPFRPLHAYPEFAAIRPPADLAVPARPRPPGVLAEHWLLLGLSVSLALLIVVVLVCWLLIGLPS